MGGRAVEMHGGTIPLVTSQWPNGGCSRIRSSRNLGLIDMVSAGGRWPGLQKWGKGSEGQASQEIPGIQTEKVQVIWLEHSDWKPSVPLQLQHLPLQQFDDQSVIDGSFHNMAWKTVLLAHNSSGLHLLNFLLWCRLVFLNTSASDKKKNLPFISELLVLGNSD